MDNPKNIVVDTNEMPWEDRYQQLSGVTLHRKLLFQEPETGMLVQLVRYPAGFVNPLHTHPCGKGRS